MNQRSLPIAPNYIDAQVYIASIEDVVSRSAILILRSVISDLDGIFQQQLGVDRLEIHVPLDVLSLFRAVDETFECRRGWLELTPSTIAVRPGKGTTQALAFIDSIENTQARSGLYSFVESFSGIAPEQDLLFCCRFLELVVFNDQTLPDVLSGRFAREVDELTAIHEKWSQGLSNPPGPD